MDAPAQTSALRPGRRQLKWWLSGLLIGAVAFFFAWQLLLRYAANEIRAALGPDATVASIRVGWTGVEIEQLVLAAPAGWPTKHAAQFAKVRVVPDWFSVFSGGLRVSAIELTGAQVSLSRTAEGRWRVLPQWTERPRDTTKNAQTKDIAARHMAIGAVTFTGSTLTLADAQIARPAHRIVIEQLHATIKDVRLGGVPHPMSLDAMGRIGAGGHAKVAGRITLETRDANLDIAFQRVPLSTVEPYLLKAAEAGVRSGDFDLQLRLNIAAQMLDAPGHATVRDLELKPATGASTFMGLPRDALVERLKDHEGRIDIPFHLKGRIDDPSFSAGAAFKAKLALAAADVLGLQQWLGEFAQRSGVSAQVERAAERIKRWLGR